MDPNSYQHGFQYNFQHYGDPGLSAPNTVIAPPMQSKRVPIGASSEGESSFNDSGYLSSPPQVSHFTALSNQLRGSNLAQHAGQGLGHSPTKAHVSAVGGFLGVGGRSPTKTHGSAVGGLLGAGGHSPTKVHGSAVGGLMGAPRPSWQEDFPNVNDEWDRNFINNFEENLFGFDAADLNNMVDGILGTPYKSSMGSPFSSPRQSRSAAAGLGLSPFKNLTTSNVMLAPRRSPARLGGSPFKSPFASPSPVKGLNSHTRTSPLTRQRRLILQSPEHNRPDGLGGQFADLPTFLDEVKEEPGSDLGAAPFQRTNSFGFTPQDELSSSPPFTSFYREDMMQPGLSGQTLQQINNTTPVRQGKRIKTESMYNLRNSPSPSKSYFSGYIKPEIENSLQFTQSSDTHYNGYPKLRHNSPSESGGHDHGLRSPLDRQSPARFAEGRISVTRHTQLINDLPPKDALRLVRARFKEVLEKASADAAIKEKTLSLKAKVKAKGGKKTQKYPEISQALCKSAPAASSGKSLACVTGYTQIKPHQPGGKRRQEILPKPSPDWPRREPCKIAPKKRKR